MTHPNQVLVAILNNLHDYGIARDQHWYRIPVSSQQKWLKQRWPPQWLAFYFTKKFGSEKHSIRYYARVLDIQTKRRYELLPDEGRNHPKAGNLYYQLVFEPLKQLPQPIFSRRRRRLVFISTTFEKFIKAVEINDLYDESPLEDRLWAEMKRLGINAERQEFVEVNNRFYALDFAVYCMRGKLNVETDGDSWHVQKQRYRIDRVRDNDLETAGWHLLRFDTRQIREQMGAYCLPTLAKEINNLGGIKFGKPIGKTISLDPSTGQQLSLFD